MVDLSTHPATLTIDGAGTIALNWSATYYTPSAYQAGVYDVRRGNVARLDAYRAAADPLADPTIGEQWHTIDGRPVQIDGVPDQDMPAAVALLVDTARALTAYRAARTARGERTRAALLDAQRQTRELMGAHAGDAALAAARRLDALALLAGREGILTLDEVAAAAGYDPRRAARLADEVTAEVPAYPTRHLYLDAAQLAARLGITASSLASYRTRGRVPDPDITLGGSHGWLLSTVEAYVATRAAATATAGGDR